VAVEGNRIAGNQYVGVHVYGQGSRGLVQVPSCPPPEVPPPLPPPRHPLSASGADGGRRMERRGEGGGGRGRGGLIACRVRAEREHLQIVLRTFT